MPSLYQILIRLSKLCVQESASVRKSRKQQQRLLRNMGAHAVVLELLQIPYEKVGTHIRGCRCVGGGFLGLPRPFALGNVWCRNEADVTIVTTKQSQVIYMKQIEHPNNEAKPPITSLHLEDSIKKQPVYSLLTPIPCWMGTAWSEYKGLMTELSLHMGLCCTVSSAVLLRHVSTTSY